MKAFFRSVIITVLLLGPRLGAEGQQRHPATRREAIGNERATQIESIIDALHPGASVVWTPELAIRDRSGVLTPVDVHDIKTVPEVNGRAGIVAVDLGVEKQQYIEHFKRGRSVTPASFSTNFVLFHMDASNHVTSVRTVPFQTGDPVTKIVSYEILRWPAGGSPVVGLSYESFTVEGGLTLIVSWGSQYDIATRSFVTKLPTGIVIRQDQGQETEDIISAHRISPTEIQLIGGITQTTVNYQCSNPCIVNSQIFLSLWPK